MCAIRLLFHAYFMHISYLFTSFQSWPFEPFELSRITPRRSLGKKHHPNNKIMDALTSQLGALKINKSRKLEYILARYGNTISYFDPGSDQFVVARCTETSTFEAGKLYEVSSETRWRGTNLSTELTGRSLDKRIKRANFFYPSTTYDDEVLPALLLGSRLRDYDQNAATVISLRPLILTSPSRPIFLKKVTLRAESGEIIDVDVDNVNRDSERSIKIYGEATTPLPSSVTIKSRLQLVSDAERTPLVTKALELVYSGSTRIRNRELLKRIYGKSSSFVFTPVSSDLITVTKRDGGSVTLNGEQSEAVRRYCSSCPGFAVESPPGTGKTLTAAAMAVSYSGPGLQLFLSTANVPVINMAMALAEMDYGNRKIVHLMSAERESKANSPFSLFETVDDEEEEQDKHVALFKQLGEDLETAGKSKARKLKKRMRSAHAAALQSSVGSYDIILATVDMILGKLLKKKNPKTPCPIQTQLEHGVRRIVVDEASQLTEAALNALIHCFPDAQIVLIGDSKQLPAYKYVKDDTVSELAAHSALVVMKRKKNLPVVSMRTTYRQAPSAMRHYSDAFYDGRLSSGKSEPRRALLPRIFKVGDKDLMYLKVKSKAGKSGTSWINDEEIRALHILVTQLRMAGYDHERVMIIAYYEAQRQLAAGELPAGYEVLTVDSAQGREKDIVIVLTTRDKVTDTPFFTCPLRCNVAVSRHKEALIVVGHKAMLETEPWKQLLTKEFFSEAIINNSK
ncbi:hypothetical protein PMAYCL1PPCAC_09511 [Pristionchus mayeri]|uniref:DNA2/NAM7 helicase-like C-terminal domain-containing protein n=1 Tax=Pristionchus mayeri TaxID=1317129 RepID=A0AAN4ZEJ2_9BILA|nr:hypothetical protein PMAYCL1PPCAC_09511 [Pristionchus mayeri]